MRYIHHYPTIFCCKDTNYFLYNKFFFIFFVFLQFALFACSIAPLGVAVVIGDF